MEDSTKEENGKSYICKEGQWARDREADAERNKCDEEGATKDSTSMGMSMKYVCTDGLWKMDMSSFTGGGFNMGDSTGTGFNFGGRRDSTGGFNIGGGTKPVVPDSTATE